jgi:hypothetical protein
MQLLDLDPNSAGVIAPEHVGRLVRKAVERNDLYIFTHPDYKGITEMRFNAILAAFDQAKADS